MQTQDVTITVDGSAMPSYLARPDEGSPVPGIIVLQEIFGVNREVKRITDLFASAGYAALAINYYHRTHPALNEPYTPEGLQHGFEAAGKVGRASLLADVSAARDWLNEQPFVKNGHIAVVGFCFGGTVAFLAATLPGIMAAVPFYGGSIATPLPNGEPEALADVAEIRAPLLLFFGGQDDYIPATSVARIESTLSAAGKSFAVQVYPNVGHAFFRDSSDHLESHEVADAWDRTQAFLKAHMA